MLAMIILYLNSLHTLYSRVYCATYCRSANVCDESHDEGMTWSAIRSNDVMQTTMDQLSCSSAAEIEKKIHGGTFLEK